MCRQSEDTGIGHSSQMAHYTALLYCMKVTCAHADHDDVVDDDDDDEVLDTYRKNGISL